MNDDPSALSDSQAPYAGLTPDRMLDALEAVGFRVDGRFLGLNSYENRVYQVMLEDGGSVVAKFYRPVRWSDAQARPGAPHAAKFRSAPAPP